MRARSWGLVCWGWGGVVRGCTGAWACSGAAGLLAQPEATANTETAMRTRSSISVRGERCDLDRTPARAVLHLARELAASGIDVFAPGLADGGDQSLILERFLERDDAVAGAAGSYAERGGGVAGVE